MLQKFFSHFQPPELFDALNMDNLSNRSLPSTLKVLQISLATIYISIQNLLYLGASPETSNLAFITIIIANI